MELRWFRRRWEESRGDGFASWGAATYFFEVGPDGRPVRQVEVYDAGPTLRYGPDHPEDEFGQLGQDPSTRSKTGLFGPSRQKSSQRLGRTSRGMIGRPLRGMIGRSDANPAVDLVASRPRIAAEVGEVEE
jgi:hypothetical protein